MTNLKVGQVFKNYKALCEFLGEKVKQGKGRQLQFKEWERYFSFHKEGYKIVIDEVYSTPKKKVDNRKNNNFKKGTRYTQKSYYKPFIKKLILTEVAMSPNCIYEGSRTKMFKYSEIITKDFQRQYGNSTVDNYLDVIGSNISRSFKTCLDELEKEGIISYKKVPKIKFVNDNEYYDLLPLELELRYTGVFYSENSLFEESKLYAEQQTKMKFYQCVKSEKLFTNFRRYQLKYLTPYFNEWGLEVADVREPYEISLKCDRNTIDKITEEEKKQLIENLHNRAILSKRVLRTKEEFKNFSTEPQEEVVDVCNKAKKVVFMDYEATKEEREANKKEFEIKLQTLRAKILEEGIIPFDEGHREVTDKDNIIVLECQEDLQENYVEIERKTNKPKYNFDNTKEKNYTDTLEDYEKTIFYTKRNERIKELDREIRFHALHSDTYVSIRKIPELNEEYKKLTKEDNISALEFFEQYEEEKLWKEQLRKEAEEDYYEEITTFDYSAKGYQKTKVRTEQDKLIDFEIQCLLAYCS